MMCYDCFSSDNIIQWHSGWKSDGKSNQEQWHSNWKYSGMSNKEIILFFIQLFYLVGKWFGSKGRFGRYLYDFSRNSISTLENFRRYMKRYWKIQIQVLHTCFATDRVTIISLTWPWLTKTVSDFIIFESSGSPGRKKSKYPLPNQSHQSCFL